MTTTTSTTTITTTTTTTATSSSLPTATFLSPVTTAHLLGTNTTDNYTVTSGLSTNDSSPTKTNPFGGSPSPSFIGRSVEFDDPMVVTLCCNKDACNKRLRPFFEYGMLFHLTEKKNVSIVATCITSLINSYFII